MNGYKLILTHNWKRPEIPSYVERVNLDDFLSDKNYRVKSKALIDAVDNTYIVLLENNKIKIYSNDNKLMVDGDLQPDTESYDRGEQYDEKPIIRSYHLNHFAGGRFVIYNDKTVKWTQYGSGLPIISSYKGILKKTTKSMPTKSITAKSMTAKNIATKRKNDDEIRMRIREKDRKREIDLKRQCRLAENKLKYQFYLLPPTA